MRTYAPARRYGFDGFSPYTRPSVIAVSEAAEGTGVGRALMERAEQWSRQRGLAFLTLNVFAANARALRLYEQAGFIAEALRYAKPLR